MYSRQFALDFFTDVENKKYKNEKKEKKWNDIGW